jgi:hypothetical protein
MKTKIQIFIALFLFVALVSFNSKPRWQSLFNGKDLTGWSSTGKATWTVKDGVITGTDGRGHLYADPVLGDLEIKGEFRISSQGKNANGGLYIRANAPESDPNGFPHGYEAQICNTQDAHTGWLWKPGAPTGKATELLTKDGEWFPMRVEAIGSTIKIWVKGKLVMTHTDDEYKRGHFALQCHNAGMTFEAKNLRYRKLD